VAGSLDPVAAPSPKGSRYLTLRPLVCHASIAWKAPYTTGCQCVVPAGEVLEVVESMPAGADIALLAPERSNVLEPWLVGTGDPRSVKYAGYNLIVDRAALDAACRVALPEEAGTRDYDAPGIYEADGIEVTSVGVLTADRRFLHEGIERVSVEERRGNRKVAGYLLLGGILLAAAIVGFAMIAAALVLYLHRRHEVVIGYAGKEVALARFAERDQAQALADAIRGQRAG